MRRHLLLPLTLAVLPFLAGCPSLTRPSEDIGPDPVAANAQKLAEKGAKGPVGAVANVGPLAPSPPEPPGAAPPNVPPPLPIPGARPQGG